MFRIATVSIAAVALRFCSHAAPAPSAAGVLMPPVMYAPAAAPTGMLAMIPEHGGAVSTSSGYVTEVVGLPNGKLVAYVRDAEHKPVVASDVNLSVVRPNGTLANVPMAWDARSGSYVGQPVGVPTGNYAMQVSIRPGPAFQWVQLVTPPVMVVQVTAPRTVYVRSPQRTVYVRQPSPTVYVSPHMGFYGGPHVGFGFHP